MAALSGLVFVTRFRVLVGGVVVVVVPVLFVAADPAVGRLVVDFVCPTDGSCSGFIVLVGVVFVLLVRRKIELRFTTESGL